MGRAGLEEGLLGGDGETGRVWRARCSPVVMAASYVASSVERRITTVMIGWSGETTCSWLGCLLAGLSLYMASCRVSGDQRLHFGAHTDNETALVVPGTGS